MDGRGPVGGTSAAPGEATAAGLVRQLADVVGSAREARWIVEHVRDALGLGGPAAAEAARALAARRAAGEPLQYVLGRWPFRTVDLDVDRRVLIPRPETEQVVGRALDRLAADVAGPERGEGPVLCADLGTGSGAIALSLAAEAPLAGDGLEVWATDRSPDALEVARANRDRLAAEGRLRSVPVHMAEGDWFDALPVAHRGRFDLVVTNPPYVAESEFAALDPVVREFEPRSALVAPESRDGTPGMGDVGTVIVGARPWLRATGWLVVELAPHQAPAAARLAEATGYVRVEVAEDLAGLPRMVLARC